MDSQLFAQFNVTCHTEGCENSEITILITTLKDNPHVTCGPCGVQIQDVVSFE